MNKCKLSSWIFTGFAILLIISLFSCKKTSAGGCWECNDNLGNPVGVYCGSDEQDAFDHSGTINGVHTLPNFQSHCHKQ